MPPPPPPSKSYLLVLDTDSEDEQEDASYIQQQQELRRRLQLEQLQREAEASMAADPPQTTPNDPDVPSTSHRCRRPHVVEDDEDDDDEQESATADEDPDGGSADPAVGSDKQLKKKPKKNKKRHKKKKKRTSKEAPTTTTKHNVSFSDVSIQTYARTFGVDVVPGDGGWPLGMELEPLHPDKHNKENEEDAFRISIDEYERIKQERLKARWELVKDKCKEEVVANMTQKPDCESGPLVFETRQWDYKSGVKNPLFKILHEEERRALFLARPNPVLDRKRSSSMSISEDEFDSGSFSLSNDLGDTTSSTKRRTRSSSVSSSGECFNDTYDQVFVHHVRNELEQIRVQRSASGSVGCDCRKLTVYIPPR